MVKKPNTPPPGGPTWEQLGPKFSEILKVPPDPDGKYLHWDELRHRDPPEGLTAKEWWYGVTIARRQAAKPLPLLKDDDGEPFVYVPTDRMLRQLHELDKNTSGRIQMNEAITNPQTRDRYIFNSLIEEAITSSQLEGASTTTEVAKEMIRSGRRPVDRSERMILNNYNAMGFVREFEGDLTPDKVFELHRVVTDETLEDPDKAGCFRTDADQIAVTNHLGTVLHWPPAAAELPSRLEAMCAFANGAGDEKTFIHPVVRAIVLHFWVGYDHPFVDGNGRTARALFYWSMLEQGYWLTEFLSISRILKNAPAQYARSFLFTETDSNDLTYFLDYQLGVIQRAVEELEAYLKRKVRQVRRVEALLEKSVDLNHRQIALLSHALRHPGQTYTIEGHRRSNRVVYQTARTDLLDLADRGLLRKRKSGSAYIFSAPSNLGDLLKELAEADDGEN